MAGVICFSCRDLTASFLLCASSQVRQRQQHKERRMQAFHDDRAERESSVLGGIYAGHGERKRLEDQQQSLLLLQVGVSSDRRGVLDRGTRPTHSIAAPTSSGRRQEATRPPPSAGQHRAPDCMSEEEWRRQMRYPGVKPRSAQPRSTQAVFEPPFMR